MGGNGETWESKGGRELEREREREREREKKRERWRQGKFNSVSIDIR